MIAMQTNKEIYIANLHTGYEDEEVVRRVINSLNEKDLKEFMYACYRASEKHGADSFLPEVYNEDLDEFE